MPNSIESSPTNSGQVDKQTSQPHPLENMPSFGESVESLEVIRSRNQKIGAIALRAVEQSSPDYPTKDPEIEIKNAGDRSRQQPLNEGDRIKLTFTDTDGAPIGTIAIPTLGEKRTFGPDMSYIPTVEEREEMKKFSPPVTPPEKPPKLDNFIPPKDKIS